MNTTKSIIGAVVALAVGLVIGYFVFHSSSQQLVGAVGVKYAEQYDPYIKYNGGYYSNLPIVTNATSSAYMFCEWNGTNFTLLDFTPNSTSTASFSTSTTCY